MLQLVKWNTQDRKRRNYYHLICVGIKELILINHSAQKGPPPPLNSIKGSLLRCHSVNPRQYCSNLFFSHHLGCYYLLFTCLAAPGGQDRDGDHLRSHRPSFSDPYNHHHRHHGHHIALRPSRNFYHNYCFSHLWRTTSIKVLSQIKNFCSVKDTVKRMKRQVTDERDILSNHISYKKDLYPIYRENFLNSTIRK